MNPTPAPNPLPALPPALVLAAAFGYLVVLFLVAAWADRRGAAGRSVIGNAWVYALSMGVYCTAWTYFGSIGRAAAGGLAFLPIYLGPTLAMTLAWIVLRKMIRIAREQRITTIADFVASRYGRSRAIAVLVTLVALVGVVPYVALQLKAVAAGYALLTGDSGAGSGSALAIALVLAAFTIAFGTRHLDTTERHEGLVAAIALESIVKLVAFVAVGAFVTWGLFGGAADLFERAAALPAAARVIEAGSAEAPFAPSTPGAWLGLVLLAMLSVILLPRQFQVMVVENVDEAHVRRAAWAFPAYLLAINLFVLPIAAGGIVWFASAGAAGVGGAAANPETFVLSLPLAGGQGALALVAFIGGLSAATGMVIVEAIAVSTMVCNDLVLPLLLKRGTGARGGARGGDLTRTLLGVRRAAIVALLLLGWLYFQVAGEAYALVSIGLISFAAVAQFAPALLGGLFWKGGTRVGALAGLGAGALLWAWTLMLPSIAKSGWTTGWLDAAFLREGPFGITLLRPEALFGATGMDSLTHGLFWSLLVNTALFVGVSLFTTPSAAEASQAHRYVDALEAPGQPRVFWRGRARVADLVELLGRFLGRERASALIAAHPGAGRDGLADAALVQFAEAQLAGAIGSASARTMVASVVEEDPLTLDDVLGIVEEASALRELNRQLQSLDRLKDDFMSSVTHELRTPLASIRALAELMRDEPDMEPAQRQHFLGILVAEAERLSRLVNQVLDMAKIESGQADWHSEDVDLIALVDRAAAGTTELLRERGARLELRRPERLRPIRADGDRLLQVMLNLLGNAAKFVPATGGLVTLTLAETATGVRIEVQDNGPGVPDGQQELVFEKFRQGEHGGPNGAPGRRPQRPQGTGLGLPISRRIVEHFGGRLWLRQLPGQGACFGFDLPWPAAASGRDNDDGAGPDAAQQRQTQETTA